VLRLSIALATPPSSSVDCEQSEHVHEYSIAASAMIGCLVDRLLRMDLHATGGRVTPASGPCPSWRDQTPSLGGAIDANGQGLTPSGDTRWDRLEHHCLVAMLGAPMPGRGLSWLHVGDAGHPLVRCWSGHLVEPAMLGACCPSIQPLAAWAETRWGAHFLRTMNCAATQGWFRSLLIRCDAAAWVPSLWRQARREAFVSIPSVCFLDSGYGAPARVASAAKDIWRKR